MMDDPIITDAQITTAFADTNFGARHRRQLLEQGVLKTWAGFSCGSTLTRIMCDLGLITKRNHVTVKGRRFAFHAFYNQRYSG